MTAPRRLVPASYLVSKFSMFSCKKLNWKFNWKMNNKRPHLPIPATILCRILFLEIMDLVETMIENYYDDEGKKSARCSVCYKTYIVKHIVNLRNHIEAQHLDGPKYKCSHCNREFNTRMALRSHLKLTHLLPSCMINIR